MARFAELPRYAGQAVGVDIDKSKVPAALRQRPRLLGQSLPDRRYTSPCAGSITLRREVEMAGMVKPTSLSTR